MKLRWFIENAFAEGEIMAKEFSLLTLKVR